MTDKDIEDSTMNAQAQARQSLEQLYAETSKHAQYQTLPDELAKKLGVQFEVNEAWRGDRPRYPLLKEFIQQGPSASVLDVGANTGFFSLSLAADLKASAITACELNSTHAKIIRFLAEIGGYSPFHVTEQPADLQHVDAFGHFDVALHLNILHHAGHDFDKADVPDRGSFMQYGVRYLSGFRATADRMVFQMGYNWGGNKELPLVALNDQAGKVRFTMELLDGAGWDVQAIGLAKRDGADAAVVLEKFAPDSLPSDPSELDSFLKARYGEHLWSEFYQRPLWFCKSRTAS